MIEFKCQCGHQFSEPDDHAGRELQCPTCLRLVDVPTLGDLQAINPDGTYVLHESQPQTSQPIPTLDEMVHAFRRDVPALGGIEKDLRHTEESLANVGSLSLEQLDQVLPPPPRYDPETGELLTPIEIGPQEVKPIVIVKSDGRNTLKYAAGQDAKQVHYWRVPLELLKVPNLTVMAFSFFCQLLLAAAALTIYLLFPIVLVAFIFICLLAHYGSIPQEIGYQERDDLPRPLGDLGFVDDIFSPMGNMIIALGICYGPALFGALRWPQTPPFYLILGALALGGSFVFPAVLLTLTNGGSLMNLRPDRVLGVIRAIGAFYIMLAIEWIIAGPFYVLATSAVAYTVTRVVFFRAPRWWLAAALGAVILAIYFLLIFLWQLGLTYRAHGDEFPWILQRYERLPKA